MMYLKKTSPLWIFHTKSNGVARIFIEEGCKRITKKEYDSYEQKGPQEGLVSTPRRKRVRSKGLQ